MPLYDFVCTAGHKSEAKAGYDVSSVPCPDCGKPAQRSAVNELTFAIAGRVAIPRDQRRVNLSKFMDAASDLEYHHKTTEERQGRKIDNPSYFHEGVKRAKEVMAGRRAPPKEF